MKIKSARILLLLMAIFLLSCDASPPAKQSQSDMQREGTAQAIPGDALAKVGNQYVTVSDYEKQSTRFSKKLAETENGRKYILEKCVEDFLIEKEAESRGLTRDPLIVSKIENYARKLYRAGLQNNLKAVQKPVTDEEAKKYFEDHKDKIIRPDKVRMSVLELAPNQKKEIYALHRKLKSGRDFAELAKQKSKHASARTGGDLGFLTRKQYPPLTKVAFTLKPGKISDPFKTDAGWTVVKVTDFVKKEEVSVEEGIQRARARLEAAGATQAFGDMMKERREKTPVAVYEDRLKQFAPPQEMDQKQDLPQPEQANKGS